MSATARRRTWVATEIVLGLILATDLGWTGMNPSWECGTKMGCREYWPRNQMFTKAMTSLSESWQLRGGKGSQ